MPASALSPDQIHYLRTVLGVEGFIVPSTIEGPAETTVAAQEKLERVSGQGRDLPAAQALLSTIPAAPQEQALETLEVAESSADVRVSGSLKSARLIVLTANAGPHFPLEGQAGELAKKMIQAMKLSDSAVYVIEWTRAEEAECPDQAKAAIREAGQRPVLVFGEEALIALRGEASHFGTWISLSIPGGDGGQGRVKVMPTLSPRDLLKSPEQKRVAWVHLQAVMKLL